MSAIDKLNFVKDGVRKLPPGFRFEPTDEEIVFQYLARKIFSYPLPASVIPEINICKFDPWELPGDSDQDRYLFSNKETSNRNGDPTSMVTSGGYWKETGSDKQIMCSKWMPIVGIKKTFVFFKGKNSRANSRTDWLMHEYHIARPVGNSASNVQQRTNSQDSLVQIGNWVLCHIFLKKRSNKADGIGRSSLQDFTTVETSSSEETDSSSASSSSLYSDSSALTEVSSNVSSDDQNA
ncbi:NAC domain containing protein 83 [Forsythia ovata]|uniref:NAC domain containing protein 83 n=1 Tax=Forsythia ovata TaxID=205694 RepID=A0ABD1TRG1_9LAMI